MGQTFDQIYASWLDQQIESETNLRRKALLQRGLSHGTVELLRKIWYPAVGSLDHLYAEYEVRDFNNGYRYLDLAYMPGRAKGCIEVQDFRTHARDIEAGRFKDLCMKQALLALDDWLLLPIAYLSIRDDPGMCKQLILSFIGKFLSQQDQPPMNWAALETIRYARRMLRPFTPNELAEHLQLSRQRTAAVLHSLTAQKRIEVASGKQRYRSYRLALTES